ncbi:hypothetical protein [Arenimonas sp.]|uniref:hypothetical protein n=1 Tax=Arenimonas sp. TaxID=1872635 RepID=UPI0039E56CD7
MSVEEQTPYHTITADGSTTVFAYPFKILDETHLDVTVDGAAQVLGVDYTVDGVGEDEGGEITFFTAPSNGLDVDMVRDMPLDRAFNYEALGVFNPDEVDADFDRIWLAMQQVRGLIERAGSNALLLPLVATLASNRLPEPEGNSFLGWNSAGDEIVNKIAVDLTGVVISAFWEALLEAGTVEEARTLLGLGALATLSTVGTGQITDGAVTPAKLAAQAAYTLLGNATAGSASPTAVSLSDDLSLDSGSLQVLAARKVPATVSNTSIDFSASDAGRCIRKTSTATPTYTVQPATHAADDVITVQNLGASGNITIAQGSGVTLQLAGGASTGNRTVAPGGIAYIYFDSATHAVVSGAGVT